MCLYNLLNSQILTCLGSSEAGLASQEINFVVFLEVGLIQLIYLKMHKLFMEREVIVEKLPEKKENLYPIWKGRIDLNPTADTFKDRFSVLGGNF